MRPNRTQAQRHSSQKCIQGAPDHQIRPLFRLMLRGLVGGVTGE